MIENNIMKSPMLQIAHSDFLTSQDFRHDCEYFFFKGVMQFPMEIPLSPTSFLKMNSTSLTQAGFLKRGKKLEGDLLATYLLSEAFPLKRTILLH